MLYLAKDFCSQSSLVTIVTSKRVTNTTTPCLNSRSIALCWVTVLSSPSGVFVTALRGPMEKTWDKTVCSGAAGSQQLYSVSVVYARRVCRSSRHAWLFCRRLNLQKFGEEFCFVKYEADLRNWESCTVNRSVFSNGTFLLGLCANASESSVENQNWTGRFAKEWTVTSGHRTDFLLCLLGLENYWALAQALASPKRYMHFLPTPAEVLPEVPSRQQLPVRK